jgi:competence ComEA-like helix-hairpin-helix protein
MTPLVADRARVGAGSRIVLDGERIVDRGRMDPNRLAAWNVPVNVNSASAAELTALDGIGPKLAERIIAARPFACIEEVARVQGIGARRLARLKDRLVLDAKPGNPL